MAWGIEQLGQRRSPAVAFDPELWSKLGEKYRGRQYAQDVVGAMQSVEGTGEEANEKRLRAMAEKYAAFDPAQAQNWISAADQIRERIEARQQQENQFTRGQDLGREQMQYNQGKELQKQENDEIDNLAVQYRNARNTMASPNWNALNDDVKQQTANELKGIAEILKRSERGRALMGQVDNELPAETPKTETTPSGTQKPQFDLPSAKQTLKGMAVDKEPDGRIDNVSEFDFALNKIIKDAGIGENDPNAKLLRSYAQSLKDEIKGKKEGKVEGAQQEADQFSNDVKKIPRIDERFQALSSKIDEANTVLIQAKNNPKGASYMAMKKSLGDAIGGADFAGLMGKDIGAGIVSKFMNLVNASPVNEDEAKMWVRAFIGSVQAMVNAYNSDLQRKSQNLPSKNKIIEAYSINQIESMPEISGGGEQSQPPKGGNISMKDWIAKQKGAK